MVVMDLARKNIISHDWNKKNASRKQWVIAHTTA